jgi:hypothetical protein
MQWTAIVAATVGTVLGVGSTLVADRIRRRGERSERDRTELRTCFMEYLGALAHARDAFSRIEPSPERVGRGHTAIGEYGVYNAQHQLELVVPVSVPDKAGKATLAVLDFYDSVVAGYESDSDEYRKVWRAAREARGMLVEAMRTALRRS